MKAKKIIVAIIGFNGIIGKELLKNLLISNENILKIKIFSERKFFLKINSSKIVVNFYYKFNLDLMNDVSIIYFCLDSNASLKYFKKLKNKDIYIIDKSSAFRLLKEVPLIVSEINDFKINSESKLISNPNCVVIPLAHVINVFKNFKIKSVVINTFQSVSGAGNNGIYELENQFKNFYLKNIVDKISFREQIFLNLFPQIPNNSLFNKQGDSEEEEKIRLELVKILNRQDTEYYINCTRVPLINCHSFYLNFFFNQKIHLENIINILNLNKNIKILNDYVNDIFPNPFYSNFIDLILLGRIKINKEKNNLSFFCCTNNLRFGTVLNVIKITNYLIKNNL